MRELILSAACVAAVLTVVPYAAAQTVGGPVTAPLNSNGVPTGPLIRPPPAGARGPKIAPPPALPGAQSRQDNAAPASRSPNDMEPTEALFDAINRGDIGTARDAISRGADLHGHNILGMTPLELSVDLGRNDISFLLLSMRAGDSGDRPPPHAAPVKAAAAKVAKPAPARPVVGKTAATQQPVSQNPRLFADDGGAPNPNAGFLGFDASRR